MTDEQGQRTVLFEGTSKLAGDVAARTIWLKRRRILSYLAERGPATLFEIAAHLGVFDHQIAGRFTELCRDGLIERTGQRRVKPETGCEADVWKLAEPRAGDGRKLDLADGQGYPSSLLIAGLSDGEFWRSPVLASDGDLPGVPYSISREAAGLRLCVRVALIECEGCGRPLKLMEENGRKLWRCGQPGCNRTWELKMVRQAGGVQLLALVMERM